MGVGNIMMIVQSATAIIDNKVFALMSILIWFDQTQNYV